VKQAVVGYGRAEKSQVQQMVKAILSLSALPPETPPMPWPWRFAMQIPQEESPKNDCPHCGILISKSVQYLCG